MFTGIVEAVGSIAACQRIGNDARVTVAVGQLNMQDVALGDSIAVNGTCVTVVSFTATHFTADVSAETLSLTSEKQWQIGVLVNLEKALTPHSRLGGHMMSGHVDGVGRVVELRAVGVSKLIRLDVPAALARYIAKKGSIALDGISLTVNEVLGQQFTVNIVPHTAESTNIPTWRVGSDINLEVDIIARYLERLVLGERAAEQSESASGSATQMASGITEAFLLDHGFGR